MNIKHCPTARSVSSVVLAIFCFTLITAVTGNAQTFTSLASFNTNDGKWPGPPLVQGLDGNFYGLTQAGGKFKGSACSSTGCGTIFKITPEGTLTTLYAFCSQANCPDGFSPSALVLATDGNFYGTTFGGGNSGPACFTGFGCGTVFKLSPNGTLTTLYSFCASTCADGAGANGLIQASDGNFYGTTVEGGAHSSLGGTIFRISASGVLTTVYSFCALANCTDGEAPVGGLIQATNRRLYGTTSRGGANYLVSGGTIFSTTLSGQFTKLYDFCSQPRCTDGSSPQTAPIQAANGVLYGTTSSGGSLVGCRSLGCGTIFKFTPGGVFTTVYRFCSETNCSDGQVPDALLQATDGNLYGTTDMGGARVYNCGVSGLGCGTIFKIGSSGALTTLYIFCPGGSCTDGSKPDGLMQSTDGSFYGTTTTGGTKGPGTVFNLSVGLGPFVQTLPTSGKVGTEVTILGTNLTGTTSVSFHGTEATFTLVSPTQIATTVPTGATTGTVTVTTPSATLKSNVAFRVLP